MNIILASKSPRRKKLLEEMNLKFDVITSSFNEEQIIPLNKAPHTYCMQLAQHKCRNISNKYTDSLVIGADTIVYHNKKILNKPKDRSEAKRHLKALSNDTHIVYTGVCVNIKSRNTSLTFYDKSYVTFYKLNHEDINYYIDNFEPYDKAGSYGIQDWSMAFVKKINGCFNNVVGFPIAKFLKLGLDNNRINKIIKNNFIK